MKESKMITNKRVALMVATVPSMIGQFNMSNIKLLQELGYKVLVACNFEDRTVWNKDRIDKFIDELKNHDIEFFQVDFPRSPTNIIKIKKIYNQLYNVAKTNEVTMIHCHTPVASVIARMVSHKLKIRVIYTAHGFHFYKGAPKINWLIYYPIEKFFSKYTDTLITINKEDYTLAIKKMKAKNVEYVPGVGVDIEKIDSISIDKNVKRTEIGVPNGFKWVVNVGELSHRKNQEVLIRAISDIQNCFLTIAGRGDLYEYYENLIKSLGLEDRVKLLGFRTDVIEICKACDLFVFPSLQEGLPVALMEAMACEVPVVCSEIRGNVDLIQESRCLFQPKYVNMCKEKIEWILGEDVDKFRSINRNFVENLDVGEIKNQMKKIYD